MNSALFWLTGDPENSYSLTVFVDVKDAYGAITRTTATITVMPKAITTELIASSQVDIVNSFDSGDLNAALSKKLLQTNVLLSSVMPLSH